WDAGIVVVAPAGNDGLSGATLGAPANNPKAICVTSAADPHTISAFATRGDGHSHPTVAAPGEFITGWDVHGSEMDQAAVQTESLRHMNDPQLMDRMQTDPAYAQLAKMPPEQRDDLIKAHLPPFYRPEPGVLATHGSCPAAAEVAGIAADLLQARPDATPDQVKQALIDSAHPMGSQYSIDDQGHGFADAWGALQKLSSYPSSRVSVRSSSKPEANSSSSSSSASSSGNSSEAASSRAE
ncbi:MAG TPA: S8 family serine peptidase, partial [Candidatus Xenobia bacterium]